MPQKHNKDIISEEMIQFNPSKLKNEEIEDIILRVKGAQMLVDKVLEETSQGNIGSPKLRHTPFTSTKKEPENDK